MLPLLMRRGLWSPGVFAIVAIILLSVLQWRPCRHQAGVVALVMMVSSPLLMRRHLYHCHDDIVALIVLAPLPTLHRCCCPCCASVVFLIVLTYFLSRCMGVVTIIAPALLPLLSWRVCAIVLVLLPLSC